tara:strand:- start:5 stop:229 length:225 start_codon:yes stop_codon:yes gene_type:complete
MNCIKCDKVLKSIGNSRKNGKDHDDWNTRQLHKKCWKELKEEQKLLFCIYCNDDEKLLESVKRFKKKYNLQKLL